MNIEARNLLIRSKLYRLFAMVFAAAGFILFLMLYFRNVQGQLFDYLTNPFVLLTLFAPFVPALFLSMKASKLEKKFRKLTQNPPPPAAGA